MCLVRHGELSSLWGWMVNMGQGVIIWLKCSNRVCRLTADSDAALGLGFPDDFLSSRLSDKGQPLSADAERCAADINWQSETCLFSQTAILLPFVEVSYCKCTQLKAEHGLDLFLFLWLFSYELIKNKKPYLTHYISSRSTTHNFSHNSCRPHTTASMRGCFRHTVKSSCRWQAGCQGNKLASKLPCKHLACSPPLLGK